MEGFTLPLKFKSKFNFKSRCLFWGIFLFFGLFGVGLPLLEGEIPLGIWVCSAIFGTFSLFALYIIVTADILGRYSVKLTQEKLSLKLPFNKKVIYWKEIDSASLVSYNNNTFIGLILKEDLREGRRSVDKNLTEMLGVPAFSFQFSTRLFTDIDPENLISIIDTKIAEEVSQYKPFQVEEEPNQSFFKAILLSFASSIVMSLLYALSIIVFDRNIMVIPLFSSLVIIAVFNKYYIAKAGSIHIRLLMGSICFFHVPLAISFLVIFQEKLSLTITNVSSVIINYIDYLICNYTENIFNILIPFLCFYIGTKVKFEKRERGDL